MSHRCGSVIGSTCPSVCLCVCAVAKHPLGDLWSQNVFLILAWNEKERKKCVLKRRKNLDWILSPYAPKPKSPSSGCRGDLWSKNVFLILACDDTILFLMRLCFIFWGIDPRPPTRVSAKQPLPGVVVKGYFPNIGLQWHKKRRCVPFFSSKKVILRLFWVSVLLSTSIKRVSVSSMRDFLLILWFFLI